MPAQDLLPRAPGRAERAWVVGEAADGTELAVPLVVVSGRHEGPTLWIDAAMHGDEVVGVVAGWRLLATLRPETLRGRVIFASLVNPSAYRHGRRTSPVDRLDMNRVFPGARNRSHTYQLAERYGTLVRAHATHYVNLHCGRTTSDVVFYALYRAGATAAADTAEAMARAAGTNVVWRSADAWLEQSLFALLQEEGIPSVILEAGGEARARSEHIAALTAALGNIAALLGIADGAVPAPRVEHVVTAADFFHAPRGGIWVSSHRPGDLLRRGEAVGELKNAFGDTVATVNCTVEGGILLSLRTYSATPSGAALGIIGTTS